MIAFEYLFVYAKSLAAQLVGPPNISNGDIWGSNPSPFNYRTIKKKKYLFVYDALCSNIIVEGEKK